MLRLLLPFIAPPRSLGGTLGCFLTDAEERALRALEPVVLLRPALRRRGIRQLDAVVAGARYGASPLLRGAIRRWKYRNSAMYASACVATALRAAALHPAAGVLCPVPLHWSRLWMRGFNQAQVLADAFVVSTGTPVHACLARRRSTGAQALRSTRERRAALSDTFVVVDAVPAHVTLVDDVVTTGATLDACALALRRAGCERVDAIVIAA